MSTRCNIIIKDKYNEFWLYHHHDGYPEGVGADLTKRMNSAFEKDLDLSDVVNMLIKDIDDEYEITTGEHGDIEYLYKIDVDRKTLSYQAVSHHWEENGLDEHTYYTGSKFLIKGEQK